MKKVEGNRHIFYMVASLWRVMHPHQERTTILMLGRPRRPP